MFAMLVIEILSIEVYSGFTFVSLARQRFATEKGSIKLGEVSCQTLARVDKEGGGGRN